MEAQMNRKLKILISSYMDGECERPEIVEDMLKEDKKAKQIYTELLTSKKIKNLEYEEYPLQFDQINTSIKKEPIKQLLVTAGVIIIAILCLLPLIKNSYRAQEFKTEILTEASR